MPVVLDHPRRALLWAGQTEQTGQKHGLESEAAFVFAIPGKRFSEALPLGSSEGRSETRVKKEPVF